MAYGNQSAFLSAAAGQSAVLGGQVTILDVARGPGGLRQRSLQPAIAGRDAPSLPFSGAFFVAGRHPSPRGQVFLAPKRLHFRSPFLPPHFSPPPVASRNSR